MKKILTSIVLLFVVLMSAAANDIVSLTFNRTGTDAASVGVLVKDGEGNAIEGVSATLTSVSHALKATANNVTSSIVCPDANANTNPTITMTFTVSGLPQGYTFGKLGLDIHALNGSGNYQQNNDNVVRHWNVEAAAGNNTFASFSNIDIAAGVGSTGAVHKVWETDEFASVGLDAKGNLVLTLTITKGTTNNGCFFGLSEVCLMTVAADPEPDPNLVYSPTTTQLTSSELNQKTEATLIAIKNLSATNHYYFVGNTGATPYSKADFSNEAVFVWTPVQEGVAGSYYLKKLDGTYMQQSSPKDFGTVDNAAVFTTTNPTSAGNGATKFNGDGDSQSYIDCNDDAHLVRFVTNGKWINVQNGDSGTPTYNTGLGGWTIHYVYTVEGREGEPDPEPTPDPEEVVHTFSADKVYYITWKNTGANYITENRDKSLMVADKKNSKYQFWRLIPVADKSHCYKVQNVVTGNYLGSCNKTPSSSSRVSTSATAVEYYIGATAATSGEIEGCHYFSSTDCENYSNEAAGPRALNKDGASSYVITWQAGTSRTGSYWKIVETTEEYQIPEPPAHTEQTKDLVVYFRPCGMVGNTYLTAATIDGVDPVSYTATAAPSSFYVPYSKDHGAVMPGSTFNVNITLNNSTDADLKANAYFDWNADGEFESTQAITLNGTTGTAEVTVPEGAVSGDTRMRIRLNSNGLNRADDDVEGFVYDIPFAVVGAERKVLVAVNGADRGTATLSATAETYAVGTKLTATATPMGNAEFDSWREGGVVVSREAEYTFAVENRNMTLKAYFTPNTEITSDISAHKIGTFYANEAVNIPDGVTAYVATTTPVDGVLTMTPLKDIIPAQTGVVICGAAGSYTFTKASEEGTAVEGNFMRGYAGSAEYIEVTLKDGYTTYVLAVMQNEQKEDVVGFYRKEAGFRVYNNKAYLQVPISAGAPSLAIRFDDGTTSIDNEQLTIDNESTAIYDLMGRRVAKMVKDGMYVVGGKKVVIR